MSSSEADMRTHVRALRSEAVTTFDFSVALDTAATLVQNVLEQPENEKFRSVRLANATFHNRLGRFSAGIALLHALGFEAAHSKTVTASSEPSHLALPEADPQLLAHGLVLMKAARQAAELVEQEEAAAKGAAPAAADAGAAAPSSSSSAAAGASSSSSSSKANGKRRAGPNDDATTTNKRPANDTTTAAAAAAAAAETAVHGAAVELTSYTVESIDEYFLLACGGPFLEGLASVDGPAFANLCATAREARRIAAASSDADAEARAAHWASVLEEHGELLGWKVDDTEEAEEEEAAGGSGGAIAAEEDHGPAIIAEDGNFDDCAVCGGGGELICCESCPQAYHRACLGPRAPPEDDDGAWFCPPCAEQLGMV